jgi:hypothetical protein
MIAKDDDLSSHAHGNAVSRPRHAVGSGSLEGDGDEASGGGMQGRKRKASESRGGKALASGGAVGQWRPFRLAREFVRKLQLQV